MGKSWAKFVCDFETHHGIPNTVACAKAAAGTEMCLTPFPLTPDPNPTPNPNPDPNPTLPLTLCTP